MFSVLFSIYFYIVIVIVIIVAHERLAKVAQNSLIQSALLYVLFLGQRSLLIATSKSRIARK